MSVNLARDIEHCYLTKELREVLLNEVILLIYHVFPYFFLNLSLSLSVIRVSIHQSIHSFHFLFLLILLLFKSLTNDLNELFIIICSNGIAQLRILVKNIVKLFRLA